MMFDEEGEWEFNSFMDKFNFFPQFNEVEKKLVEQLGEPQQEHTTPPTSLMQVIKEIHFHLSWLKEMKNT